MDIHVDELVNFVFLENTACAAFTMSLDGIETTQDLFFFLLDFFCKGMVVLFGKDCRSVDLTSISQEQFKIVADKLAYAGILLKLAVVPDEDIYDEGIRAQINSPQLLEHPPNSPLESFVFKLKFNRIRHDLSFSLGRL